MIGAANLAKLGQLQGAGIGKGKARIGAANIGHQGMSGVLARLAHGSAFGTNQREGRLVTHFVIGRDPCGAPPGLLGWRVGETGTVLC
jgi:hypothetical protein